MGRQSARTTAPSAPRGTGPAVPLNDFIAVGARGEFRGGGSAVRGALRSAAPRPWMAARAGSAGGGGAVAGRGPRRC